jgi:hypothetical protein
VDSSLVGWIKRDCPKLDDGESRLPSCITPNQIALEFRTATLVSDGRRVLRLFPQIDGPD